MEPYHAKIGKYIDSRDNKFQKLKTRELFKKPILSKKMSKLAPRLSERYFFGTSDTAAAIHLQ